MITGFIRKIALPVISALCFWGCSENSEVNKEDSSGALVHEQVSTDESDSLNFTEIKCPHCSFKKVEELPTDVCQIAYTCTNCSEVLHPKKGDCCVFCSYGTHKCPSMQ